MYGLAVAVSLPLAPRRTGATVWPAMATRLGYRSGPTGRMETEVDAMQRRLDQLRKSIEDERRSRSQKPSGQNLWKNGRVDPSDLERKYGYRTRRTRPTGRSPRQLPPISDLPAPGPALDVQNGAPRAPQPPALSSASADGVWHWKPQAAIPESSFEVGRPACKKRCWRPALTHRPPCWFRSSLGQTKMHAKGQGRQRRSRRSQRGSTTRKRALDPSKKLSRPGGVGHGRPQQKLV